MKGTRAAFRWIVGVLRKHRIPFQITGGLAARAYGSDRPLVDIDIDVREEDMAKLAEAVRKYVVYGPKQFRNRNWDLKLMTLEYRGQLIDIGGAASTRVRDHRSKKWVAVPAKFGCAKKKMLYGLRVPVVQKEALINYKTRLGRRVDKIDLCHLVG